MLTVWPNVYLLFIMFELVLTFEDSASSCRRLITFKLIVNYDIDMRMGERLVIDVKSCNFFVC